MPSVEPGVSIYNSWVSRVSHSLPLRVLGGRKRAISTSVGGLHP